MPRGWPGWGMAASFCSEILPNVLPVIVIAMSTTIGWMILETAGLSFLGLGSQPPQADLGSMLGEARAALITAPHTSVVPGRDDPSRSSCRSTFSATGCATRSTRACARAR